MSQPTQQTSSFQPGQAEGVVPSGKQMFSQSSNEAFNLRQGSNQPESQSWRGASKQYFQPANQQQSSQWQPLTEQKWKAAESPSTSTGAVSGGIRAVVKDASGQELSDSTIRVRIKGEEGDLVQQQPQQLQQDEQESLPQVFRDLKPGEVLHPLEEIDNRALWTGHPEWTRTPESGAIAATSSVHEPFLQKPLHKPLNQATIYEQQQEAIVQQQLFQARVQEPWHDKELRPWSTSGSRDNALQQTATSQPEWSETVEIIEEQLTVGEQPLQDWARSDGTKQQLPPVQPLPPRKSTRPVRYPPTPDQLMSQKGKLKQNARSQEFGGKPILPEMTRPGVDDARRPEGSSNLPVIREEGELVQMGGAGPARTTNPNTAATATTEQGAGEIVLKDETPPHVEAVPLDLADEPAHKEGFFGKLKHIFSEKHKEPTT